MKYFIFLFTTLLISSVVSSSNAAAEPLKVGLNWKAEPEFGGFYAAKLTDSYKKHGLDVLIQEGGAGTPTIQMVAAGTVDFGVVSADEVVLAQANGQDVVALYAVYQKAPYGIMVRADSNVKDLKQLFNSGMTVSLVSGLPFAVFLEKTYGFSKSKIVPYAGGVASFVHDKNFAQQCFASSEPRLAENAGVKAKVFLAADNGFNPYVTVLVTKAKTLKEKPEVVKNLVAAVREGWGEYVKNPGPTNIIISKLNSAMDLKTLGEMVKIEKDFVESPDTSKNGLGTMTKKRWESLVELLKKLKLIKKPVAADKLFVNL